MENGPMKKSSHKCSNAGKQTAKAGVKKEEEMFVTRKCFRVQNVKRKEGEWFEVRGWL